MLISTGSKEKYDSNKKINQPLIRTPGVPHFATPFPHTISFLGNEMVWGERVRGLANAPLPYGLGEQAVG